MAKVGIVTAKDLKKYFVSEKNPLFTHDDQVLVDHLERKGHNIHPVIWGGRFDPTFDCYVIRSPWDYMDSAENRTGFFDWIQSAATKSIPMENSPETMLWNLDKVYLRDLEAKGIPIVETFYVDGTQTLSKERLQEAYERMGPFVLKPSVSAAARDTFLIRNPDKIENMQERNGHITGNLEVWRNGRTFMIQPFLESVKTFGELSLIVIGGEYSHCVRKLPPKEGWLVQDELGGSVEWHEPEKKFIDLAELTIAALDPAPLYARVDILLDQSDQPVIGELELVEPELFFLDRRKTPLVAFEPGVELFCKHLEARLSS